ncbi:MAG: hypothetical protein HY537_08130 [Deltaproteobacteria bacterium]|nr:hypothetical protein [Deltaproteobacteria bacterium]
MKSEFLVDQADYGTNRPYYRDVIEFWSNPYKLDPAQLKHFYVEKGLSANQIAEQLGVAKSTVLSRLRRFKLSPKGWIERASNPNNYRLSNPPYGYVVRDGKLIVNRSELKVCRLIVWLMRERKISAGAMPQELERRRVKNRKGTLKWGYWTIRKIFERWKETL